VIGVVLELLLAEVVVRNEADESPLCRQACTGPGQDDLLVDNGISADFGRQSMDLLVHENDKSSDKLMLSGCCDDILEMVSEDDEELRPHLKDRMAPAVSTVRCYGP
jgi:hypothetical protein